MRFQKLQYQYNLYKYYKSDWFLSLQKASAEQYCQTTIGPKINTLYDALTSGSKWKSTPEKEFKTTTDLSFCEYDSDLGIFMGCQDQRYHRFILL